MKRILLYGAGRRYKQYFNDCFFYKNVIEDMGIEIKAICDGDEKRWGEEILIGEKNYLIQNILTLDRKEWDAIVVTSKEYFLSIKKDLMDRGFEEQTILEFDEFVHKALFENDYKYQLSLVLMIRNESEYICEWIEYHRIVGVDHFYIYDNESYDGLSDILSDYISEGIVSYHFWTGGQVEAYDHAVSNYKLESKYMGFNDTDEFIVPLDEDSVADTIEDIFLFDKERFLSYPKDKFPGGIGISWKIYGTSGHRKKPEGLVIENYKYCATWSIDEAGFIKIIANPRTIVKCDIHFMYYIQGYECISENGSSIPSGLFFDGHFKKIRINHYWSRSEEELFYKICRGSGCGPYHRAVEENEKMTDALYKRFEERLTRVREYFNVEYDYIMDKFVERVKEAIARRVQNADSTCGKFRILND